MHLICVVCLILAATPLVSDGIVPAISDESRSLDSERTFDEVGSESVHPFDDVAPSLVQPTVDAMLDQDEASSSLEAESDVGNTDASADSNLKRSSRAIEPNSGESSSAGSVEPITLDELLRQIRETPHLQREALLTRLAERRRLAIAVRTTLEAAEQVAAFGQAGAEMLQDASIDAVVATMIEAQEQRSRSQENSDDSPTASVHTDDRLTSDDSEDDQDTVSEPSFDAWRLVYIVRDSRGQRIGWRHAESKQRAVVYVGEHWNTGDDTVTVVAVATNRRGRYLVVEVNGERREVHLF